MICQALYANPRSGWSWRNPAKGMCTCVCTQSSIPSSRRDGAAQVSLPSRRERLFWSSSFAFSLCSSDSHPSRSLLQPLWLNVLFPHPHQPVTLRFWPRNYRFCPVLAKKKTIKREGTKQTPQHFYSLLSRWLLAVLSSAAVTP